MWALNAGMAIDQTLWQGNLSIQPNKPSICISNTYRLKGGLVLMGTTIVTG